VLVVTLLSLLLGDYRLAPQDILSLVFSPGSNPVVRQIVVDVRLPRLVLGMLVGFALGVSGVLAQSVLRNPLGEPGLLGVNSGAALAVTVLVVLAPHAGAGIHALGAFAGAMLVAAAIYAFSSTMRMSVTRLVLVGVGFGTLMGGLSTGVSLLADIETAQRLMTWLAGSVYDSTWTRIALIGPWLAPPAVLAWLMSRDLDILTIGEDVARGLGLHLLLTTAVALSLCAFLSAVSVTLAGPIAFVGLIAPHLARRLGARNHAAQLPLAGLFGALIVASADLFGRSIMPPVQLPVGLVTPLLGAPLIGLVILWRRIVPAIFGKS
jgi:iron complex transport system permease protein